MSSWVMKGLHFSWAKTKNLPKPNQYVQMMCNEFSNWAYDEEKSPTFKGKWRSHSFQKSESSFLDLEIGPGNGNHFAHHALKNPDRLALAIELKYKPIVQTVRRALDNGSQNARVIRYNAYLIEDLFSEGELNNVYIHFPDPWVTPRKPKNRLVCQRVLDLLWDMQQTGSKLDFKTDSREYFLWAIEEIRRTKYKIEFETLNLHSSSTPKNIASENFVTQFENIFIRQGIEINFVRLRKT